jgi:hypothetical protein
MVVIGGYKKYSKLRSTREGNKQWQDTMKILRSA